MERINKVKGSILGGAIGDALGYQIEFKTHIKDKEVTKYTNDEGIISDDTQMSLFTANALLWRETRLYNKGIAPKPVDAIYLGYLDWLQTQIKKESDNTISWLKEVDELNITRAPGSTCLSSLMSNTYGTLDKPINNSKGCGSVMRVAPIGLMVNSGESAGMIAAESAALTHGNPLAIISAYVCAAMINILLNSELTVEEALSESLKLYHAKLDCYDKSVMDEFDGLIAKAISFSKNNKKDIDNIKQIGEGWSADEALAIAIYSCLKYSNNFKDCVVCAINHDGDSDSTGAIAGNIIGTYLGVSEIPDYYVTNLELLDVIQELADDMVALNYDSEYWASKYIYTKRDITKKR